MFEQDLFLAYPLNRDFQSKLHGIEEAVRSLFIQNHQSDYLQYVEHEGNIYLCKNLGPQAELASLESASRNLISLLKRLVPDIQYHNNDLILLALDKDN